MSNITYNVKSLLISLCERYYSLNLIGYYYTLVRCTEIFFCFHIHVCCSLCFKSLQAVHILTRWADCPWNVLCKHCPILPSLKCAKPSRTHSCDAVVHINAIKTRYKFLSKSSSTKTFVNKVKYILWLCLNVLKNFHTSEHDYGLKFV